MRHHAIVLLAIFKAAFCLNSPQLFTSATTDGDSVYVNLTWHPVFDAFKYNVFYYQNLSSSGLLISTTSSTNATFTIPTNWNWQHTPDVHGYFNVTAMAPDVRDGLVGYYMLNGDGVDYCSQENNGNVFGAIPSTDRHGNISGAMDFDGIDDYIGCGNSMVFDLTSSLTVSAWIKTHHQSMNAGIVGRWNNQSGGACQYVLVVNYSGLSANLYTDGGQVIIYDNLNYADDLWHFYTMTWDGSVMKLYSNAQLVDARPTLLSMPSSGQELSIGRYAMGVGGQQNYFNGSIDDVRIYNRALNQSEIETLFYE